MPGFTPPIKIQIIYGDSKLTKIAEKERVALDAARIELEGFWPPRTVRGPFSSHRGGPAHALATIGVVREPLTNGDVADALQKFLGVGRRGASD